MKDAMMMMLTARRMDAQEARRVSLINDVVPGAQLMQAARHWRETFSSVRHRPSRPPSR